MAYTDDAVRAKLASLNETQESVVSVAQWIMFHRRHADRTANLWLQRLREVSTSKRLNLIYLSNEVVQQSRARSKQDFLLAFEPIVAEASALAYKGADGNVRGKVRRVVEVWRERKIFDGRIQDGIEAQLDGMDKDAGSKGALGGLGRAKAPKLGGGLFAGSGGVPAELESAAGLVEKLGELGEGAKTKVGKANEEFAKMTDPSLPVPTPPVHAARLSALGKTLASAQGAVEASLKARTNLISQLEELVSKHRTQLESEEALFADLTSKREGTEAKKNEVEDGIMRGLSTPSSPDIPTPTNISNSSFLPNPNGSGNDSADERRELDRPEAEDFTPPPEDRDIIEAVDDIPTDPRMRQARNSFTSTTGAEAIQELPPDFNEPPPAFEPPPAMSPPAPAPTGLVDPSNAAAAAEQFLSNLSASGLGQVRQASQEIPNGSADPRLKRRKLSQQSPVRRESGVEEDVATAFDAGVDEEGISALLQ